MYYLFPFHLVKKDCNLILYGAGNAGKNFVKQIEITNHCKIVGIVDKNNENVQVKRYSVYPIEWLIEAEYDFVFITIVNEKIQREIKNTLLSLGIDESKIITFVSPAMDWDRPNRGYFNQREEYEMNKSLGGYLEEIDPKLQLSSDRIDIIVRYLLFCDFMNEIENKEHLSLYSRFILARTGGHETDTYFSGKGKNSVQEFIDKGRGLCKSIKENGFEREFFIPLGADRKPYDGLHRIAAALAAGEKIYVHNYSDRAASTCDMKWFKEQGFCFEDRLRIVRGFTDIFPGKCGMFVLYAPFYDLWDYMEGQIGKNFKIIDSLDFHYEDNYIAFENVLRQIYWDQNQHSEWLTRKLDLLSFAQLKYRIVVISDEMGNKSFYEEIRALKKKLREALYIDVDGRVPIQLHSSDTEEEFYHLSKIFLSANQYKWDLRQIKSYYRNWFLVTINKLKKWCNINMIKLEDVCIVGGGVLELFGIRNSENLNFVVKSSLQYDLNCLDRDLEIVCNYGMDENGKAILDDIIIDNCEYHIVFSDIKFCNPEYVYRYKKRRNNAKDKQDVKRIEDWRQMVIGMEDKRYLNQQVQKELYKRGLR